MGADVEHTGDVGGFVNARKHGHIDVEQVEHSFGPPAIGDIQQQHSAGIGNFGREISSHAKAHVVFGQQNLPRPRIETGLVFSQPQDLGRGEARQRGIGNQLN